MVTFLCFCIKSVYVYIHMYIYVKAMTHAQKRSLKEIFINNHFMSSTESRGPFLTSPLAPRREICPLGEMFTPSFTPRGEHSLLFRRMEGRTENFTPRGHNSPLGDKFAPRVKFYP
jgi:hypothetical protein